MYLRVDLYVSYRSKIDLLKVFSSNTDICNKTSSSSLLSYKNKFLSKPLPSSIPPLLVTASSQMLWHPSNLILSFQCPLLPRTHLNHLYLTILRTSRVRQLFTCIGNWLCLQLWYILPPPPVYSKPHANSIRPKIITPLPLAYPFIKFVRVPATYRAQEVTLPTC
jgi:hypothetical protein